MTSVESEGSRRRAGRDDSPDRRRQGWDEFRRAYPGILWTMSVALLLIIAADMWLLVKRHRYLAETERLRQGMTALERQRTDLAVASEGDKMQVMVELMRRQSAYERELHLTVSVDSATMHLAQEGATLRTMRISVGPERRVGEPPDTVHMAPPRGVRTVARVLGEGDEWEVPAWVYADRGLAAPQERSMKGALGRAALVLDGGTVIYSLPATGPLSDSSYVLPGGVRAGANDLIAIVPNMRPGLKVYFY